MACGQCYCSKQPLPRAARNRAGGKCRWQPGTAPTHSWLLSPRTPAHQAITVHTAAHPASRALASLSHTHLPGAQPAQWRQSHRQPQSTAPLAQPEMRDSLTNCLCRCVLWGRSLKRWLSTQHREQEKTVQLLLQARYFFLYQ